MRIVFLGTPDFAVASLKAMLDSNYQVVAVITAPDKPAGRGQKIQESAVKQFAVAHGIPVLQPTLLKNSDFLETLKSYQADIQVVVAFRMLPEVVWNMPKYGTVNVHGSLLPQYRGAAPINHAIINGEKESGVSTFFLKQEIDTGNIILSEKVAISATETAGTLHDKLMLAGAKTLIKTLQQIENNTVEEIPQPMTDTLKHAPKLTKAFCKINWEQDTETVYNHIRGLSPYPAAYTHLQEKNLKIFNTQKEITSPDIPAGSYKTDGKTYLKIATQNGYLSLLDLQLEGKKRMHIDEFLRGYKLS